MNPTPLERIRLRLRLPVRGRVRASGFDPESMAESVPESKSEYVAEFGSEFDFDSDAERFPTRDNTLEYFTARLTTTRHTMP